VIPVQGFSNLFPVLLIHRLPLFCPPGYVFYTGKREINNWEDK
jgi:hypothetical protein